MRTLPGGTCIFTKPRKHPDAGLAPCQVHEHGYMSSFNRGESDEHDVLDWRNEAVEWDRTEWGPLSSTTQEAKHEIGHGTLVDI